MRTLGPYESKLVKLRSYRERAVPELGTVCARRNPEKGFRKACSGRRSSGRGFTLVELLIVLIIIMILSAMAIPNLMAALYAARVARAVGDINAIEADLEAYAASNSGNLPNSLASISRGNMLDPWGHPYQYLNFATAKGKGAFRKDKFLVPLNSDYDLYSMGRDGLSKPPITAKASQDDILRANDGSFVGLASQY